MQLFSLILFLVCNQSSSFILQKLSCMKFFFPQQCNFKNNLKLICKIFIMIAAATRIIRSLVLKTSCVTNFSVTEGQLWPPPLGFYRIITKSYFSLFLLYQLNLQVMFIWWWHIKIDRNNEFWLIHHYSKNI